METLPSAKYFPFSLLFEIFIQAGALQENPVICSAMGEWP
jgi:hypothetical protein